MNMILFLLMAVIGGIAIGYALGFADKVETKDYDTLLHEYASFKAKVNEKVYIGATYTNGYIDLIVSNCSDYEVWFSPNEIKIENMDKDIFNEQFRLKGDVKSE